MLSKTYTSDGTTTAADLEKTFNEYKARLEKFAEEMGLTVEKVEAQYSKDELLLNFRFEVVNEFIFSSCELVKE